jgi:hypothetical protein
MGRAHPGQRHQGGVNATVLPLPDKLNTTDIGATTPPQERVKKLQALILSYVPCQARTRNYPAPPQDRRDVDANERATVGARPRDVG